MPYSIVRLAVPISRKPVDGKTTVFPDLVVNSQPMFILLCRSNIALKLFASSSFLPLPKAIPSFANVEKTDGGGTLYPAGDGSYTVLTTYILLGELVVPVFPSFH